MDSMFGESRSLKYLNLKHFNTSEVSRMEYMFGGCKSLISLIISNFDTSRVTRLSGMFNDCKSLISLDLKNFDASLIEDDIDIFSGCNQSLIYCINEDKATKILSGLSEFNNSNCSDNCFTFSPSQLIVEKNICIDFCYNDDIYKFEYNNICYKSCPNGTHNSSYNDYICEEDLICDNYYNYNYTGCLDYIPEGYYLNNTILRTIDKCDIKCGNCSLESIQNNNSCITCNANNNSFINCYNEGFEGYFLDMSSKMYILCYSSCKNCDELGNEENNKCTECFPNYILNNYNCKEEMYSDYSLYTENNYDTNEIFSDYSLYNEDNNNTDEIFSDYSLYIENNYNTNEIYTNFISNELDNYTEYTTNEVTDYNKNENDFSNYYSNNYLNLITDNRKSNEFDISENNNYIYYQSDNNKGQSLDENIENIINQLVLSKKLSINNIYYYNTNLGENNLRDKYNNITFIDFPEETLKFLINQFHLDEEKDKIYLLIIDYLTNDFNYVTTDYDYKIFLENGTELNLSNINEDFYFDIYVPIIDLIASNYNYSVHFVEQGYDIYDKNGVFYNDICSPAFYNESDIIIDDRKKEIYPNNITLCKNNCRYKSINIEEKRIICECNLNINTNNSIIDDKNFLLEDDNNFFSYLLDNINYKIFKCYKLILSFSNLKNNYAFYAIIFIAFLAIITNIYFCLFGIKNIRSLALKYYPSQNLRR